jgi:hypothetical protein
MVLAAYYLGHAFLETELINGLMAVVGKFPYVLNHKLVVIKLP